MHLTCKLANFPTLQVVLKVCLLQGKVGIKQKRHRENIAEFIKQLVQDDEALKRYVTLSVEGNISAGKSTFLNGITAHCPDLQDLVHVRTLLMLLSIQFCRHCFTSESGLELSALKKAFYVCLLTFNKKR